MIAMRDIGKFRNDARFPNFVMVSTMDDKSGELAEEPGDGIGGIFCC
jgi:hypothetical protein